MTKYGFLTIATVAGLAAAAAVAATGHDGWGWILFVTVMIVGG